LGDLFNNALDINTNLPMWTRNTSKYGDNFVFLKLDPEKGVVGCLQLPNIEIERIEIGMKGKHSGLVKCSYFKSDKEFDIYLEGKHLNLIMGNCSLQIIG
jgi:hypothetical protein